ncbi:hypothetical protein BDV06DRAFT_207124, partial [Aspergillus oleicola]
MLRCSNAAALRAQFTTTAARRAPISSTWLQASNNHLCRYRSSPASEIPDFRDPAKLSRSSVFRTQDLDSLSTPTPSEFETRTSSQRPNANTDEQPPAAENALTVREFKKRIDKSKSNSRSKRSNKDEDEEFTRDPLMQIAAGQAPRPSRATIEKEMVWLSDPRKLADRVAMLLREKKYTLAVELARQAIYRKYDCDVAWNHIFKYCMVKRHAKAAFRFWNDFKKRGGTPNKYAYTIMLDGLAEVEKRREIDPLRMAQAIYRAMTDPKNTVETGIIQMNAMLKVCQKQPGAMDVLWEVAGSLPEEGPMSPDGTTYTIIFNAIRWSIQRDVDALKGDEPEQATYIRLKGIIEAKRLWVDILHRWKNGSLEMSNKLVSAMAGCLWEGTGDRHLYEVLQLYEQTAGIPIFAEEPLRGSEDVSGRAKSQLGVDKTSAEMEEEVPFVDNRGKTFSPLKRKIQFGNLEDEIEDLKREEESFRNLFSPVVAEGIKPYKVHARGFEPSSREDRLNLEKEAPVPNYMPIGNRELSVILETVLQMVNAVGPGKEYWKHLTEENTDYKVVPDHRSLIGYLRVLRVGRTSRICVDAIRRQLDLGQIEQGLPFHIALSTCRRDRKNPNVLRHAHELLSLMDYALMLPDHRALTGYLDLVRHLEDNPQDLAMANTLDESETTTQTIERYGRELRLNLRKSAIAALRPHAIRLDDAMAAYLENPKGKGLVKDLALSGVNVELVRLQSAPAGDIAIVLTRIRHLVDTILKTESGKKLTTREARAFEEDSRRLRKYSKIEIVKNLQEERVRGRNRVYPTVKQQIEYRDRMGSVRPEAKRE